MFGSAPAAIGFGEVGQTFARGLLAHGTAGIRAYDLLFGSEAGRRLEAAARSIGVACRHQVARFQSKAWWAWRRRLRWPAKRVGFS